MTIRNLLLAGGMLLLGACAAPGTGTPAETSLPESWPQLTPVSAAGTFDAGGLTALAHEMESFVDSGMVIGVEWLLVKDGEIAQYGAYGDQTADGRELDPGTIYRIYSMTKPITGVALMQLYEDGEFELDDPVTDYIPQFADLKVLAGEEEDGTPILVDMERPPTMREVMSHTAGFAYGLFGEDYANRQFREKQILGSPDLDTLIEQVADVPLLFQPGEKWSYSVAVDVQAYLVEHFAGVSFGEYLDANVFGPLNMDDTGFYVPDEDYARFADLMFWNEEAGRFVPGPREAASASPELAPYVFRKETVSFQSGGHGLVSTIDDYARFCQMMLNGGALSGERIIEPETVALMTRDHLPDGAGVSFNGTMRAMMTGEPHKFGLDFGVITDPDAMASPAGKGTYYWGGAAGTWFWIDPENDLFFIGMIQRFGQLPDEEVSMRARSMELVYEALADGNEAQP